jgi:hypothetical protein
MNKTEQVADDAKPMTGIWYRARTDHNVLAKVTAKTGATATVAYTGGTYQCTNAEFARTWEMV